MRAPRSLAGLAPWSLFFALFGLVPLLAALLLSFTSLNPLRPDLARWVGLGNYGRALGSPVFWHALGTTAFFVVGTLPPTIGLAYVVAALLARVRRGEAFFRAAVFVPATLSMVVIALVFKSLYAEEGLLNGWIAGLGLPRVHWLQDPALALPAIMAMDVWASVGYYAILILAGRKTLPRVDSAKLSSSPGGASDAPAFFPRGPVSRSSPPSATGSTSTLLCCILSSKCCHGPGPELSRPVVSATTARLPPPKDDDDAGADATQSSTLAMLA